MLLWAEPHLNMNTDMSTIIKYRTDIDGLRAIAILGVVIYHAFPSTLPGGFTGVDIFFVISGYLISGIIFKQSQSGNFSFSGFYSRRIKRIFPALITVLLCVVAYGWRTMLSDEFTMLGKHVAGGLGFVQNIVLYFESGYFDAASETKPLMHLWSLGVEEQFYIFFPMIALVFARSRKAIIFSLILISLCSFALNIYFVKDNPSLAFYNPLTRVWELISGSILAWLSIYKKPITDTRATNSISVAGLALLVCSITMINKDMLFPGWVAIMPVLGAALLILAGPGAIINKHLLSNKLFVFIGLISYPLYLWHWPVMTFLRLSLTREPLVTEMLSAIVVSVLLSWLTYQFIEKPVRFGSVIKRKVQYLSASGIAMFIVGLLICYKTIQPANDQQAIQDIVTAAGEWDYPNGLTKQKIDGISVYATLGKKNTLFFGDSNIEQYSSRIVDMVDETRGAIYLTGGGCVPINGIHKNGYAHCDKLYDSLIKLSHDKSVDTIVIGGLWKRYFADISGDTRLIDDKFPINSKEGFERAMKSLSSMLNEISAPGRNIYVVMSTPIGSKLDPKKIITRHPDGEIELDIKPLHVDDFMSSFNGTYDVMRDVIRNAGANVIEPIKYLCRQNECSPVTPDNRAMYKDAYHLRPSYIRSHVRYLDTTMGK